jgi:AbrB family looped-hinge helix DNA binding protein
MAKVTSKGQVTIPVRVRRALDIESGDDVVFELGPEGARLRKRIRLTELCGALPATRPYPGKAAIREEVAEALGRDYESERGSR